MEKNVPLTRAEVKALPKGFTVTGQHPTNRERRIEKQRGAHHNAKQTAGRKYQTVPITQKQETKFGEINVPTGWNRRLAHLVADNKVTRAALKVREAIFKKKAPAIEPQDKQKEAA